MFQKKKKKKKNYCSLVFGIYDICKMLEPVGFLQWKPC